MTIQLWRTEDGDRWFLVPETERAPAGTVRVRSLSGRAEQVDQAWLQSFEVGEHAARQWAMTELGYGLDEVKKGIEVGLRAARSRLDAYKQIPVAEDTAVTPEAVPAMLELLRKLPRVVLNSLSGDADRIDEAREAMVRLQRRLRRAGIDLDQRFSDFPERLAELRQDFEDRKSSGRRPRDRR